jgi:hypothetical protein
MKYVDWFRWRMKKTFNKDVPLDEISYEAYEFYHDELDEYLVPQEHLERLPNPLILETNQYVDVDGYEWIAGIVEDQSSKEKIYEVWIKNGEPIAYEFFIV